MNKREEFFKKLLQQWVSEWISDAGIEPSWKSYQVDEWIEHF